MKEEVLDKVINTQFISTWYNAKSLQDFPEEIPIKQIYLWIVTFDKKTVIVSKDNKKWQFPGGKPKDGETVNETILREVYEETGLNISSNITDILPIGYYIVEDQSKKANDIESPFASTFQQQRYLLLLSQSANKEMSLQVAENPIDPDPIKAVKLVDLYKICEIIPWLKGSPEYTALLRRIPRNTL